jgi:ABC-type phosphate transport system substrate-binding protein
VALAAIVLLASALAAARDLAVVSNKNNTVQELTLPELAKVCKGQTTRWPDGKPVTFVMMAPSSPEMKTITQRVYEAAPSDIENLIVTANHERKNHPAVVVVNSPEAVVQRVESTPGAIGVVDVYSITSGVTVLKIAGKLPLQPGYALHGN